MKKKGIKLCILDDVSTIIALAPALKFNGGGHINHGIFWQNMSPDGGGDPEGDLLNQINADFGSVANMKKALSAATVGIQGSGWGWLGYNKQTNKLQIATCANQDPLLATTGELKRTIREYFFLCLNFCG